MMSGNFRAVVTATAAAGIGVTTFTPRPLFEITVVAIALVVALGWAPLLPQSGRRLPITIILVLVALGASYAVYTTQAIDWLAPIFALALIAIFVAQMFRRDGTDLVDQVAGHFAGAVAVAGGAGWLAVDAGPTGKALTLTAAACIATAAIITALPLPTKIVVAPSILIPPFVGYGIALNVEELTLTTGLLIGVVAGLLVAALHFLFTEYADSMEALPSLAGALIAVSVSGVPIYILGKALLHMP